MLNHLLTDTPSFVTIHPNLILVRSEQMKTNSIYLFILVLIFSISCKKNKAQPLIQIEDCITITFSNQINDLFQARCIICHGIGATSGAMTNYDEISTFVDNGRLKSRVLDIQDMPSGSQLTTVELHQIQCWLEAGASNN